MGQDNNYTQTSGAEVKEYLELMMEHRGASLLLERDGSRALPVILLRADPAEPLLIDLGSASDVVASLQSGEGFRLAGEDEGKLFRTQILQAENWQMVEGALRCEAPYPEIMEVLERRDSYRAVLREGMECEASVSLRGDAGEGDYWEGALRDLSMNGCLLEFPMGAATSISALEGPANIELVFPNETRFAVVGELRHCRADVALRVVQAGFLFNGPSAAQSRELWYLVREIERESARSAVAENEMLRPSELFQRKPGSEADRRRRAYYGTPMARKLATVAEFLHAQILLLRKGGKVDSIHLSRTADRLLSLYEQDREALLFATVCLWDEPWLVQHCLSVAVRLMDLAGNSLPRELHKQILAAALVHDLGRVLLPAELEDGASQDAGQHEQFRQHPNLLLPRLSDCSWLRPAIVTALVEEANERLDGSGYPNGKTGEQLRELARMMAVVDSVDYLGRTSPIAKAESLTGIYACLLRAPEQYDSRWVKRYVLHFGRQPIGSLLRYPGGQLARVLAVAEDGRASRVQLSQAVEPTSGNLGEVVEGSALAALGDGEELLAL